MAAESNLAAQDFQIDAERRRCSQPVQHLAWTEKRESVTSGSE